MSTGLTIAAFAAAGALIAAAVVLIVVALKLWKTADAVSRVVQTAEEDMVPLLSESRATLKNVAAIAVTVKDKADRADRLFTVIERLLSGLAVATAATKTMRSSSVAVTGVLEGLKLGLRALRGAPKESKEVSGNE